MKRTSLSAFWADAWRPVALYGALFVGVAAALLFRLGSLLPGYSPAEASAYRASLAVHQLLHNPLNAPFLLLTHAINYLVHGMVAVRLSSALIGLLTAALFCALMRHWHERRGAVAATVLFTFSAWFLHASRFGGADVLSYLLLALAACGFWVQQTGNSAALILLFVLCGLVIYIPGMVWLVVLAGLWRWKTLDAIFKKHLGVVTLGGAIFAAMAAPLVWAFYRDQALITSWLGLPHVWPAPLTLLHQIADVPIRLFFYGQANPETWLGHLPVLDALTLTLFGLGAYVYWQHLGLRRAQLTLTFFVVGAILIGVDALSLSVLVPFVYMVAGAGASFLLDQWYSVFPRNPVAHATGLGLIGLAVALSCAYNMRAYFVAWPQANTTRSVYIVQEK